MSVQRKSRLAAVLFGFLICVACGDVYRPTIIPQPVQPPDPKNVHSAFTVNQNGTFNPGTGMQVNVSGDSAAGVTKVANLPVHATLQGGRVWVANQGSNSVSAFTIAAGSAAPIGTAIEINLPGGPTSSVIPAPDFVYSTETSTMYVANTFEHSSDPTLNGTLAVINSFTNTISNTIPVGRNPISLTETPTNTATTGLTKKIYVVDKDESVSPPNPVVHNGVLVIQAADQTQLTNIVLPPNSSPRWVVSRADGARVYVLTHDAGTIAVINSLLAVDAVIGSPVPVGAGADFLYYDSRTNRLYVPNPTNSTVTILDASSDSLPILATINLTAPIPSGGGAPCPNSGCSPTSVAALPDGSRAYVASYYIDTTSANCQQTACLQAQVTVIDQLTNQVTKVISLPQASVSPVGNCAAARFRISAAAAADNSRVYVSSCDAGRVDSINTSGDIYFAEIPAPVSAFSPTLMTITGVTQTGAETTYNFTYSQPAANTPIYLGLVVTITGMSQASDNGTFTVTGLGNGTFTVSNPTGVSSATENGTGVGQPPAQNPVFLLTGS